MEKIITKILVLASGRGSNFRALCEAVRSNEIPNARIVGLITNNKEAPALDIAETFKIPSAVIDSDRYRIDKKLDRAAYEKDLLITAERFSPDLVCLAGYMLLIGPELTRRYRLRMVNIHPSLLPQFKGLRAQKQALEAGATTTGCTVHLVTEELDGGPILLQKSIVILAEDTEDTLSARLLPIEHAAYVEAVAKLCSGKKMRIENNQVFFNDGQR